MSTASEPPAEPVESHPTFVAQVAEMKQHLEATRDTPNIDQFKDTAAMPAAFFAHWNAFLAVYDRLVDFVLAHTGTDEKMHCKKGCANCCIDLVRGVNTAETVNIYHHVRAWPDVKQIFEYHRDSAEMFMETLMSKLNEGELAFGGDDPRVKESHVEYNQKNRPCGFLDQETGCCRIYPVRPIACRYFFSLSPPETCTPSHPLYLQRDTRLIQLPQEIHDLITQIGQKLGFRPLNYLSGAFCGFAAEIMKTRPIKVIDAES